ncbi:hypothetical protein ACDX34_20345 [Acinetobacter bereziniae]|uniref:hypothetical protein n=1 Tax=Acinetobacter bereziniae TaxID=106648 RepID=UPI0039C3D500
MPTQEIVLSDKEKEIIKEVQQLHGFATEAETMEYLAKQRIKKVLYKLAGQEIKNSRHLF